MALHVHSWVPSIDTVLQEFKVFFLKSLNVYVDLSEVIQFAYLVMERILLSQILGTGQHH